MTLATHLATGTTTLCYCWVVRRVDGTTQGFTDHDRDVTVDGVTCVTTTGIVTSKFEQSLGLAADDLEIQGVIDDDTILSDDVRGGLYDNATVDLYIANWVDPTEFLHVAHGTFGSLLETEGGGFQTEFFSQGHRLSQPHGRTYQRTCDTKLGTAQCGIDLTDSAYRQDTTTVTISETNVTVASIGSFDDGYFTLGKMVTGDGYEMGIRNHTGTTISL